MKTQEQSGSDSPTQDINTTQGNGIYPTISRNIDLLSGMVKGTGHQAFSHLQNELNQFVVVTKNKIRNVKSPENTNIKENTSQQIMTEFKI